MDLYSLAVTIDTAGAVQGKAVFRQASDDIGADGEKLGKRVKAGTKDAEAGLSAMGETAKDVAQALGFAFGAIEVARFGKEAFEAAARFETLGISTRRMGQNIGESAEQIRTAEKALQDERFSLEDAREGVFSLLRAHVDLSRARELGQRAQDLSILANESEASVLDDITRALATGQSRLLVQIGAYTDFDGAVKRTAASLGKLPEELSESQRETARLDEFLRSTSVYDGTFQENTGKATDSLREMKSAWHDFALEIGQDLAPFTHVLQWSTDLLVNLREYRTIMDEARGIKPDLPPFAPALNPASSLKGAQPPIITFGSGSTGLPDIAALRKERDQLLQESADAVVHATSSQVDDLELEYRRLVGRVRLAFGTDIPREVRAGMDAVASAIAQAKWEEAMERQAGSAEVVLKRLRQEAYETATALSGVNGYSQAGRIAFGGPAKSTAIATSTNVLNDSGAASQFVVAGNALNKLALQRDMVREIQEASARTARTDNERRAYAEEMADAVQKQAQYTREAVDGGIQLVAAFTSMSREASDTLRSVSQITLSVGPLKKAWDQRGSGIAGTGTLEVIGAALPIAGAAATIVTGFLDAAKAHKEAAEASRESAKAMRESADAVQYSLLDYNARIVGPDTAAGRRDTLEAALGRELAAKKKEVEDAQRTYDFDAASFFTGNSRRTVGTSEEISAAAELLRKRQEELEKLQAAQGADRTRLETDLAQTVAAARADTAISRVTISGISGVQSDTIAGILTTTQALHRQSNLYLAQIAQATRTLAQLGGSQPATGTSTSSLDRDFAIRTSRARMAAGGARTE